MKFDKFFKMAGTHGVIIKTVNHKWLLCDGVGMQIPAGVSTFGAEKQPDDLFNGILTADIDYDLLDLTSAELPKDGKPADIKRVFSTASGDVVKISNAHYGLLEKHDRLVYLEVEDSDGNDHCIMLITDIKGEEILGFIIGEV